MKYKNLLFKGQTVNSEIQQKYLDLMFSLDTIGFKWYAKHYIKYIVRLLFRFIVLLFKIVFYVFVVLYMLCIPLIWLQSKCSLYK